MYTNIYLFVTVMIEGSTRFAGELADKSVWTFSTIVYYIAMNCNTV